ncbi:PepSY-associated TM helix domain-containing protein [Sphingomonas gellani]|uniref:PepSY-associated TM helix domain-containing protein n=1 Tax=Sphingomonas gellani TaxID=1166340 RepID=UPI000AF37B39|nr:PepSY-associated TM helix domain-containing protein [Sphingomonas gellani]
MSRPFRQSQATLHTWSGLLLGWVLFIVFTTGTIAFWREALNRWMRPELPRIEQPMRVLSGAQAFLQRTVPDGQSWYITMPSDRMPVATLFWIPKTDADAPSGRGRRRRGTDTQALVGADGTAVVARDTRGGDFFYRFHFDLHYMPVLWARWIVGVAAMMMLVAILTGIVTHKKIFRDFFTLRRGKGQRSWLDGHNATAVLALPFHLMITYTGLVTLMAMLMPWGAVANYTDEAKISKALFPHVEVPERSNRPAPLVDLVPVVRDAERRLGGAAAYVEVREPGDASARITVTRSPATLLNTRGASVAYDGVTGRPIWQSPPPDGASATAGVMIGLHAGRYADLGLRWIYFLCGVAGTVMVASGLVLWTVKRRERLPDPARPHLGFRIVERLNLGVLGGFPLAVAGFFWANRLLPTADAGRAEREVTVLFVVWGVAFVAGLILRPRWGWQALLGGTGAALIALALFDLATLRPGMFARFLGGDSLWVGTDLTLAVFGIAFLLIARRVARHRPTIRVRTRRAAISMDAMA